MKQGRRWAFTSGNAGSRFFPSFRDLAHLDQLAWDLIPADDFRSPDVKEAKQSEFLLFGSFPWTLVRTIGVIERDGWSLGSGRSCPSPTTSLMWWPGVHGIIERNWNSERPEP